MDTELNVYIDLNGSPVLVGRLWTRVRGKRESASLEYDRSWLARSDKFALEPALALGEGTFHTGNDKPLFAAIGDSAPDRWGRVLMRRAERRRAQALGETPRTLWEVDYLLMVDDESRQGALRFSENEGGPFLAQHEKSRIPPMLALGEILSATDKINAENETAEELRLLLAPGSSLGGARPKASIRDKDGTLLIAKFPNKADEIDVVRWEAVALTLAAKAGIQVPKWRIEMVADRPVLLLHRFDRVQGTRQPFLSAMSMLDARDNGTHSYLEIVDAIRQYGANPKADIQALWRRMVFNILISNTDDHLRNHGFLYKNSDGWQLSPAYDLNPVPVDISPRILSTTINLDDGTASLELALEVARYFELDEKQALQIATEVASATSKWKKVAAKLGLSAAAIDRMASAFEHEDLKAALS